MLHSHFDTTNGKKIVRAVRVATEDGPDALELTDVPSPDGELLVTDDATLT